MNTKTRKILLSLLILIVIGSLSLIILGIAKSYSVIWYILIPICGILFMNIDLRVKYNKVITDFNGDKDYFRDLVRSYSPSLLMLIFNPFSKFPLPLLAGLFQLEKKGKIKITNKIKINEEFVFLSESEAFLLKTINSGVLDESANKEYEQLVFNEGINKDLFYKKNPFNQKHGRILSLLLFGIIIALVFTMERLFFKVKIFFPLFVLSLTIYVLYNIYYQKFNKNSSKYSYYNTKKGQEIADKLNGLCNYLKGFSKMDDQRKEEINLWDDYLIYSIIFNQNKKVKANLSGFIKPKDSILYKYK